MPIDPTTGQTVIDSRSRFVSPQVQALLDARRPVSGVGDAVGRLAQAAALRRRENIQRDEKTQTMSEALAMMNSGEPGSFDAGLEILAGNPETAELALQTRMSMATALNNRTFKTTMTGSQMPDSGLGSEFDNMLFEVERDANNNVLNITPSSQQPPKSPQVIAEETRARETAEQEVEQGSTVFQEEQERKRAEEERRGAVEQREIEEAERARVKEQTDKHNTFLMDEQKSLGLVEQNKLVSQTVDELIQLIGRTRGAAIPGTDGKLSISTALLPRTGFGAEAASFFGGTDAREIQGLIDTLKSTVGIERLLEVKAQGGTFGQLSNQELNLLTATLGKLDIGLSADRLIKELEKVRGGFSRLTSQAQNLFSNKYPTGNPTIPQRPDEVPQNIWDAMTIDEKRAF